MRPCSNPREGDSGLIVLPEDHPYRELESRFARIAHLGEIAGVLDWDMQTMMPAAGAQARGEQLAALSGVHRDKLLDPVLAELLDAAEEQAADLGDWQRANLQAMRRDWRRAAAVEQDVVEAIARLGATLPMVWREAREKDDYALFAPGLREMLQLIRRKAEAMGEAFGLSSYDALIDAYDPGLTCETIDVIFDDLLDFLPRFVERIAGRQRELGAPLPFSGDFSEEVQRGLNQRLVELIGYDFGRGRLDTSQHPFTAPCGPKDVRVTTRFDSQSFVFGVMASIHEMGHALYQLNLPAEWATQPIGGPRGASLHESQSLMLEMQAARSDEFLRFLVPIAREACSGDGPAWRLENVRRHYRRVEPGPIRVYADEVTYPLHVILRYRIERNLLSGALSTDDLPGAWNDGMQELLGVAPESDVQGCLQDIHWATGVCGYFPTYTIGAVAAAQLFGYATQAEPGILEGIASGDFSRYIEWASANVYAFASYYSTAELVEKTTGKPLGTETFKLRLERRYGGDPSA